jgi:hypothetical protein
VIVKVALEERDISGQTEKKPLISHTCWPLDRLHVFAYHMDGETKSSSNMRIRRQTQRKLEIVAVFLTRVCLTYLTTSFLKNMTACFRGENKPTAV